MSDRDNYPRPSVTADAVVFADADAGAHVLLIRRDREPFRGRWAIPGGFCEPGESVEQAARRELEEETRLGGVALEQLHTYSAPGRDPRGWVISVAHVGVIPASRMAEAVGGDDASETRWWRVVERDGAAFSLEAGAETAGPLAFDHDEVMRDALAWRRRTGPGSGGGGSLVLFGLTGGLASGKSTVAARFRARGLPVIDADRLAREVVAPGSEGLAALVEAFGRDVLAPDGSLDRAALAHLAFGDPARRARLNGILHPRIGALTAERAGALAASGEHLACYEAALLVENGLADAFRPLVVVALPEQLQVARAMARDGASEAEVKARLAAQLPVAEKVAVADYVIDASGDVASVERQADEVLAAIRARTSPPVRR